MKQPILTEENFNKLPQLDRIEFRQKRDELNKRYSVGGGIAFGILFFWLWLTGTVAMTGLIWVVTHSVVIMLYIINLMRIVLWLWIIIFIIILGGEFFTLYKKRKAYNQLQLEYLGKLSKQKSQTNYNGTIVKPVTELKVIKKAGRPKKQI